MYRWNPVVLVALLLSGAALGQTVTDSDARWAAMQSTVKAAQSAGDNAWMLVSSALVLMMTGPGLALFYGGLVRKKNVLGTMMQSFILMAVVTVHVGGGGLQPGVRRGKLVYRRFPLPVSERRGQRRRMRITRPRFRSRPS